MLRKTGISKGNCSIFRFDCKKTKIPSELRKIIKIAKSQKEAFQHVYPWEDFECKSNIVTYVALNKDTNTICGWMNAIIDDEDGTVYLAYLTSRSATDQNYRGVGTALIDTLSDDFSGHRYISLISAHGSEPFYQKLGFDSYGSRYYMFKSIVEEPTEEEIEELDNIKENEQIFDDILSRLTEEETEKINEMVGEGLFTKEDIIDVYNQRKNIDDVLQLI